MNQRGLRPVRVFGCLGLLVTACCSFCTPWRPSREAVDNNRWCAEYLAQGLLQQADARCDLAIEYTAGKYAEAWNNKGQIAAARGHYDVAITYIKRAIARRDAFAEAHNNLGWLFLQRDETDAALDEFKQAIEYDPGYAVARRNYGTTLLKEHRLEAAQAELLKCVELNPNYCDCRMGLGNIALEVDHLDDARGHFEKLTEICPADARAHYNLCYVLMRQQLCTDAIAACVAALALDGGCIECQSTLTESYACKALQDQAVESYGRAIAETPGDPDAHYRYAAALEAQKLYANAADEYLFAYKLALGKHKLAAYRAARVFDVLARTDQTVEMCQRFIALLRGGELSNERVWCVERVRQLNFQ